MRAPQSNGASKRHNITACVVQGLTESKGAFQKNDSLVKVEDYHKEVRDICDSADVHTSNLA